MKEWIKRKVGMNSNHSKRFSQHSEYPQRIAQTRVDNQEPVSSGIGLKNMSPQNSSRDQSSSLDDEMGNLAYREYTFEPRKKSISSMKQRLKNAIFRHRARSVTSQEPSSVDDNSAPDPLDFLTNPTAISDIGNTYRSFYSIDDSLFVETNQNEGLSIDSHIVTSLEHPKKPVIEFVNTWYDPESSSPDSPKFKQSLDYGSEEDLTLPSEYKFSKRYRLPSLSRKFPRPEFSRSVSGPASVSTTPDNALAGSGQEYWSQMADASLSSPFVLDRVINSDPVSEKISLKLAARDRNSSVRIGVPSSTNSMSNNDSSSITSLDQSKKRESYEDKYSATSSDEAKYSIRTDSSPEYGMLKNVSTDRSVNLETKMDTVIDKKKELLHNQYKVFKDMKPLVSDDLTTVKDRSFGVIAKSAVDIANRYFIQLGSRVDTVTEVNSFDEALTRLKEGANTFATTLNESRIPVQDDLKMGIVQKLNSLIKTCISASCVNVINDCSDGLQFQAGRELEYLDHECKKLILVQSKLVQLTDLQESLSQTLDRKIGGTMYQKLYHLGTAIQDDERLCSLMDLDAKVFGLINLISNDMERHNHGEELWRIALNSIVLELELCDTQKYCSAESRNAMDTFFTECAKYKSSYLKYTGLQNDIVSILTNIVSHKPKKIFPHQPQSERVSKISDLRPDDSWIKRIAIHEPINQSQAQHTSKRSNIKPDDSWIKKNNASLINSTMKRTTSGLFDSF